MRLVELRILGEHLGILGDRLLRISAVEIHRAEIRAHVRLVGLEHEVALIRLDRLSILLAVEVDVAETAQRIEVLGVELEHVAERRLGLGEVDAIDLTGAILHLGDRFPCRGVLRLRSRLLLELADVAFHVGRNLDRRMALRQRCAGRRRGAVRLGLFLRERHSRRLLAGCQQEHPEREADREKAAEHDEGRRRQRRRLLGVG